MINTDQILDIPEYVKLITGLLAIVDIPGNLPVYINISNEYSHSDRKKIALLTALSCAVVLCSFTLFGDSILSFFGITIEAFQIAGGLLLLLMALDMMHSDQIAGTVSGKNHLQSVFGVAIFPLTIPLLAGPGALSTIIIYTHRHESLSHDLLVMLVIISVSIIIYFGLRTATLLSNKLGPAVLAVLNRVMGLIVAAIGIEFIIDGLAVHFPAWTG